MASNFLEQLVAEWYQYQGYFVRTNIRVGKRDEGGHEGELDVVAFHPELGRLVHIEASMDADSWDQRDKRFKRKFETGEKHIHAVFKGLSLPEHPERVAVFGLGSRKNHESVAGGKVVMLEDLLAEIIATFKGRTWFSDAVPEGFPILRSLQAATAYRKALFGQAAGGGGTPGKPRK